MDRDTRWERTKLAYDAIVHARGLHAPSAAAAIAESYEREETDEFVKPTVIGDYDGAADGDVAFFINFRPDRARQMSRALAEPGFDEFSRGGAAAARPDDDDRSTARAGPTRSPSPSSGRRPRWRRRSPPPAATSCTSPRPRSTPTSPTSSTAARSRRSRAKSGRWSNPPRDVPTYDHKPEMSAEGAAATFVSHWSEGSYRFGIINFANPDMVGHTGVIPAAVKAVETVDAQLGKVVEAVTAKGGACIVTADHGNCDHMLEPDGSPNTAHSLNPVPLIVTAQGPRPPRRRHPRRRRPDRPRPARHPPAGGDDGAVALSLR